MKTNKEKLEALRDHFNKYGELPRDVMKGSPITSFMGLLDIYADYVEQDLSIERIASKRVLEPDCIKTILAAADLIDLREERAGERFKAYGFVLEANGNGTWNVLCNDKRRLLILDELRTTSTFDLDGLEALLAKADEA